MSISKTTSDEMIINLVEKPVELLAWLYHYLEPKFKEILNKTETNAFIKNRERNLREKFLNCFLKAHRSDGGRFPLSGLRKILQDESGGDKDILYYCIFRALGEYYNRDYRNTINKSRTSVFFQDENVIITKKPENPIYQALPSDVRMRETTGRGERNFEVFKTFSFIKKARPEVYIHNSEKIRFTNSLLKKNVGRFKIAVTPLSNDLNFEVASEINQWPMNEKVPFWFTGLKNRRDAEAVLKDTLKRCIDQNVTVLILPELTIDTYLLEKTREWLAAENRKQVLDSKGKKGVLLLVAGSFHRQDENGNIHNVSPVLNYQGDILWEHTKMKAFSVDARDVEVSPDLKDELKISDAGGQERIQEADTLCCVDTPLGRIAVCVCIDFFHDDNLEVLKKSDITLFFVPAMSPGNSRFVETAKNIGAYSKASSFIANFWKCENTVTEKSASFYYLPRKNDPKDNFAIGNRENMLVFDAKLIKG